MSKEAGKAIRRRKRYSLLMEKSQNGSWLKFSVRSKSYNYQVIANFALLLITNCISTALISTKLQFDTKVKIAAEAIVFTFSVLIIRKPPVESLIVFRNYGVQITTVRGLLLFSSRWNEQFMLQTQFIPRDQIVDLVINEGFCRGFQVIFYLAVIVKDSKRLKLPFPVCVKNNDLN